LGSTRFESTQPKAAKEIPANKRSLRIISLGFGYSTNITIYVSP
jgi:hypothetical protein